MGAPSKHILVLRFSAMGDVALLTPVVKSFLAAFPEHKLTIVSRPKFKAFFAGRGNPNFFAADVETIYAGIGGIIRLCSDLKALKPDLVIDLHDHLRSRLICFFLRLAGIKIVRFDKGRREKQMLARAQNKVRRDLPHVVDRYNDAFQKAGYSFSILSPPYLEIQPDAAQRVEQWLRKKNVVKNEAWFGIAPFAAHKTKIWPLDNYIKLIENINKKQKAKYFLFGGGTSEISFFQELKKRFPEECVIVAGELSLTEELAQMNLLDKMICVDSSNMHLASLLGIETVSVWGGTHPSTGFGPFGQSTNAIIQIDPVVLSCRPCSVYGKEKCLRGDFACLNRILPEQIIDKL